MAKTPSPDLRSRLISAIEGGMSQRGVRPAIAPASERDGNCREVMRKGARSIRAEGRTPILNEHSAQSGGLTSPIRNSSPNDLDCRPDWTRTSTAEALAPAARPLWQ